jgi:transcriptional regulator with XRE-family HTH domain
MIRSVLAARVRTLRGSLGRRRHEIAVEARISPATVARIERGEVVPLPATVAQLERALRVEAGVLEALIDRSASGIPT